VATGELSSKYGLDMEHFNYERDILKFPAGPDREGFKVNLMRDEVLSAEIRILAWLYHEFFGE